MGAPEIEDFMGWVQTPTVLAQTVAASPPVVVTGNVWQRLATTQSARRSRAYPLRFTKLT